VNVPRSLLETFVSPLPETAELADLLAGLGLGVEAVHDVPGVPAGVVVAEILEASPIEGSDHLTRTVVHDGESTRVVVCGAPNAEVGIRTALALPGTHLPALDVTVGTRDVMGVASEGMLCSAKELGIYDDARGIISLGADAVPGMALDILWPKDTVFELELTPNRADAFSVLGVARDVAAKLNVPLNDPSASDDLGDEQGDDGLRVEVEDASGCPQLVLQRIDGVEVAPSPVWLQRGLALFGLRPRNNVVDVTNYVTFVLGQPSHAYDARVLGDGCLSVRRARPDETVTLLDGENYTLDPADLVIATPDQNGSKAIGLAGVMGGQDDSVRDDTTTVALEVADFDPVTVRASAKRHGLHTDAHHRFERGVDPALQPRAAAYAARLIAEVANGTVHSASSRFGASPTRSVVELRPERVEFLMGFDVPEDTQVTYLEALGCRVESDDAVWRVTPPSWRFDISIEEDLIEEVARLHGYEHIGSTRPDLAFTPPRTDATHRSLRESLAASGFHETIHYVFTGNDEIARSRAPEAKVRLSNPQGVERACLRTAIYPGLLAAAANNRNEPALALFEVGRVFLEPEVERLGLLLRGAHEWSGWRSDVTVDIWRLKGMLEQLAERNGSTLAFEPADAASVPMLHPGVAARVMWDGLDVGFAGRVHPEVASDYELGEVYVAELALPLPSKRLTVAEIVRQPYAERDVAVVVSGETSYAQLEAVIEGAAGSRLDTVYPFDVYSGPPLSEGERSIAIRMRWRDAERALRDEEVDAYLKDVMSALETAGFRIRQ